MKDISNIVKTLIAEILECEADEIHGDDAIMDDLELSSLEVLSMIADLEKHFSIKFIEKELRTIITVEELINAI